MIANYGTMPARRWSTTHMRASTSSEDRSLPPSFIDASNNLVKKGKSKAGTTPNPSHMPSPSPSGDDTPAALGTIAPMSTPAEVYESGLVSPPNSESASPPAKCVNTTEVDSKLGSAPRRRTKRFLNRVPNPTMRLENSGSVARDHLALERTFLAYVRTSLALASAGVALVQLFTVSARAGNAPPTTRLIQSYANSLGATLISLGIAVLIIGLIRFFTVQFALVKGHFPVARLFIFFIAAALAVLVVIIFGILIAGRR